jgi:hypothetical protein
MGGIREYASEAKAALPSAAHVVISVEYVTVSAGTPAFSIPPSTRTASSSLAAFAHAVISVEYVTVSAGTMLLPFVAA